MIMTNKLLPVALVAALIGGSVGAVVMHSRSQPATAGTQSTTATVPAATDAQYQATASNREALVPAEFASAPEQSAYKTGFADGFQACSSGAAGNQLSTSSGAPRAVYRNAGRSYAHTTATSYST